MRLFISGSAPLLIETFDAWQAAHRPHHPGALRHERDHHADVQPLRPGAGRTARRHGGLPAAGRELAGARATAASRCPTGEIGDIEVNGPNVFKGYWRMPEKTREEFTADGYFKTGDVGKIDERRLRHHRRAAART